MIENVGNRLKAVGQTIRDRVWHHNNEARVNAQYQSEWESSAAQTFYQRQRELMRTPGVFEGEEEAYLIDGTPVVLDFNQRDSDSYPLIRDAITVEVIEDTYLLP